MTRMSARFIAKKVGMNTEWVYGIWKDMGLIMKDTYGDWILTELGRSIGGRMSKGNFHSTPVFDADMVIDKMMDYYNRYKK